MKQASFLKKCLMYRFSDDSNEESFVIRFLSPIVRYGYYWEPKDLIPRVIYEYVIKPEWMVRIPYSKYDIPNAMFHANFRLLKKYVEEELGKEPSEKIQKKDAEIWDIKTTYYKGYRLHSSDGHDENAIDLYLWYRDELPKLERQEREYFRMMYGNFCGTRINRFLSGHKEPENLSNIRKKYTKDYDKFRKKYYGERTMNSSVSFCRDMEDLMDDKLQELIKLRRGLWT